jgi:hypothetical protein
MNTQKKFATWLAAGCWLKVEGWQSSTLVGRRGRPRYDLSGETPNEFAKIKANKD